MITAKSSSSPGADAPSDSAVFDVRTIPCRIKHAQIFQRWFDLKVGEYFVLLNDHDPVPLRYQFEAEFTGAFSWEYLERGPDEFRVKITKLQSVAPLATLPPGCQPAAHETDHVDGVFTLDARGLVPPEPLIRILNALESLPRGAVLRAQTDREPCHLFGEATMRGFRHESHEQSDGSWLTTLAHT